MESTTLRILREHFRAVPPGHRAVRSGRRKTTHLNRSIGCGEWASRIVICGVLQHTGKETALYPPIAGRLQH